MIGFKRLIHSLCCIFSNRKSCNLFHLFIAGVLLFIVTNDLEAQGKKHDVIYLKNSEVVFGRILVSDSVKGIRIENDCGINLLAFSEVDSIQQYRDFMKTPVKTRGYYNLSSLALLFGEGRDGYVPVPSLTMVNGYQFNRRLFTGLGIGYEYYDYAIMPLFLDAKYFFKHDVISPFISLKIGYGIPLQKYDNENWYGDNYDTYGGVLVSPELGVAFPVGSSDAFLVSIGYHHQQLSHDSYQYNWQNPEDVYKRRVYTNFNRISLRIAFIFR
ncbi:MAG: hypothetical protein CVT92_13450 [Bacteroidetes bacterium HGW-Bacteroidetes-1]|nr:MAG: hypothetical protein CVT92_13450 [Bacteroidetes bacterium HGW-Bacteroidetes-1]